MISQITEAEFDRFLATPARSAFRLEARDTYALGYEEPEFERFRSGGNPLPPAAVGWWKDWLDQIAELTRQGKTVSRVRVLSEPRSDYQRWELWGDPWHAQAGERIAYLPRARAEAIGLPLARDWWLLDDERVIDMEFTAAGEIAGKTLITGPGHIAPYLEWRDLAVRNATPAEEIAAA